MASRIPPPPDTTDDPDLWRAADRALDGLLDLDPEARLPALDAMQLPDPVRARVEHLLRADAALGPAIEATATSRPALRSLRGRQAGRWRIGEEIGRGGMSVVHAADAVDAPGQRAAIKILSGGTLAEGGSERLERERRALSRLNHPNIVPMLDAGVLDDGTPWLATALIEGERIDAWCDARGLDPTARVALMVHVADAVAHAHRALVVHRDLKPGNVFVDRDGHVRLLDFGIAGVVSGETERTRTLARALTPEYAAPEQFAGAPPGTAMDVYGLGALLYRLLCGRPPPRREHPDDTLAPPSAVVGAATVATARRRAMLRGDLDAIVLKALEHDPQRRYAGAADFAADLSRWLDGRPVEAQRPTLRYRAAKFVRRHRGGVTAAAIAVLSVCIGLVVSLWQAQRANLAAAVASAQSARAEAVNAFLIELFEAGASGRPQGELPTTAELLAIGALRARSNSVSQPAVRADLLEAMGRVYGTQDRHDEAEVLLREALALRGTIAPDDVEGLARVETLLARTLSRAGRHDEAIALARGALGRLEPASADRLAARDAAVDVLVSALSHRGLLDEAQAMATVHVAEVERLGPGRAVLHASALFNLASVDIARGRAAQALALLERASADLEGIAHSWELRLSVENTLASALSALQRHEEALARRRTQLALVREAYPPDHPRLGQTLNNHASVLEAAGLPDEALAASDEALSILGARLHPPHPTLAAMHNVRGRVLLALERVDEALSAFAAADAALGEAIGRSDRRRVLIGLNRADALIADDDAAAAEVVLESIGEVAADDPAGLMAVRWHLHGGAARLAQGNAAAARRSSDAALEAAKRATGAGPGLRAQIHGLAAAAAAQGPDPSQVEAHIAAADAELARLEGRFDNAALRWIGERTALRLAAGDHRRAAAELAADLARAQAALGPEDARVQGLAQRLSEIDSGR